MAIAFVANRANLALTTAVGAISIPITNANLIVGGNTLLLIVYAQNSAGNLPSVACGATITDPRGNVWVAEGCVNTTDSGSNHGGMLQVYRCLVANSLYLAGDALTITGSIASLNLGVLLHEFSGISQSTHAVHLTGNKGISATTSDPLNIPVDATGQMVFIAGGADTNNVVVTDADTLDGSWTAAFRRSTGANLQTWESHKILTGHTSSTQQYTSTWTSSGGDNAWGQLALVYDPLTPGGGSITQQFPPQDNGNYGCPDSGFEPMPVSSAFVPVDTGTAYQIEHTIPPYSFGTHNYAAVVQYDDSSTEQQQHHVAFDLYQKGAEVPNDQVTQLVFPVGSVNLGSGSSVINGGTALAALSAAGGSYVQINTQLSNPFVECQFDLFGGDFNINDYAGSRVVRIGVRFAGWKDDSSTLGIVGEGLQFVYEVNISNGVSGLNTYEVELGAWLTPDYQRSATQQLRWIGETNPMPAIPNAASYYGPSTGPGLVGTWFTSPPDGGTSWSYADILAFASSGGFNFIKIYGLPGADSTQIAVDLDFLELIVELAPERRLGNAVQSVATTPQYAFSLLGASSYAPGRASIVGLQSVLDQGQTFTVTGSPNDYVLVIREALPASTSDYYPALATAAEAPYVGGVLPGLPGRGVRRYSPMEAVGPSLNLLGYSKPRDVSPVQRPTTRRVVVDGIFAADAEEFGRYGLSFGALDRGNYLSAGSFFPVFRSLAPLAFLQVYNGASKTQKFYDQAGASYDQLRVVCKPDPLSTASLTVAITGGTTFIVDSAQLAIAESIGNGWFSCIARPVTTAFAGTGAVRTATISSVTPFSAPWQVSAVQPVGDSLPLTFEPLAGASASSPMTYAVLAECVMSTPTVVLGSSTITMAPVDKQLCRDSSYSIPTIQVTNSSSFNRILVERSIDAGFTWQVAVRDLTPGASMTYYDQECPWDVGGAITVIYRVTGWRDSDRRSTTTTTGNWSGTSTSPGAAFGLSSNVAGYSVAYTPVDQSKVQIQWSPLNPVQMIPLHGQDYQYALRIPENRGLSVTVTVLVDLMSYCCMPTAVQADPSTICAIDQASSLLNYSELLSSGSKSMSPRPYERSVLNVFNSSAPWVLKLPGGHSRFVTVQLGQMVITPSAGMFLAELTITDLQVPSTDMYS